EVIRIQTAAVAGLKEQLVKQPGVAFASVEVEIRCERLLLFVDDVHRPIQVRNEKPACASRFFSQGIDATEQAVIAALAVDEPGYRHRDVVLDLERELGRGVWSCDRM